MTHLQIDFFKKRSYIDDVSAESDINYMNYMDINIYLQQTPALIWDMYLIIIMVFIYTAPESMP